MNQWDESQISRWENEGGASRCPPVRYACTDGEDLVLLHLGRSVVIYWNELPRHFQRQIFRALNADIALSGTGRLGPLAARFLHDHSGGRGLSPREED